VTKKPPQWGGGNPANQRPTLPKGPRPAMPKKVIVKRPPGPTPANPMDELAAKLNARKNQTN